jgi:hypothetical protein
VLSGSRDNSCTCDTLENVKILICKEELSQCGGKLTSDGEIVVSALMRCPTLLRCKKSETFK